MLTGKQRHHLRGLGGTVVTTGGASVQSSTHYSKLVLQLNTATTPVVQGAGWDLDVGVRPDRVEMDFSGTPVAGEVWTVRGLTDKPASNGNQTTNGAIGQASFYLRAADAAAADYTFSFTTGACGGTAKSDQASATLVRYTNVDVLALTMPGITHDTSMFVPRSSPRTASLRPTTKCFVPQ